jgi:RTX calcium-binding nonapeptide repeat (4 copies)
MRLGSGKRLVLLVMLAFSAAGPASAQAQPGLADAVWTVHPRGASIASPVNVLTVNDQRKIDNRITAYTDGTGRLVLTAPEGLGDPDGSGPNCQLDNATSGANSAQQVSCAPGYIGIIVGDLGVGMDTFDADPGLPVTIGGVIDGQQRPLWGGPGRDRFIGGAAADLLNGGGSGDSLVGGGGEDLLIGGAGADNLGGGGANDVLAGGAGPDKLNGGAGRDLCRGAGDRDIGKSCELSRSIP